MPTRDFWARKRKVSKKRSKRFIAKLNKEEAAKKLKEKRWRKFFKQVEKEKAMAKKKAKKPQHFAKARKEKEKVAEKKEAAKKSGSYKELYFVVSETKSNHPFLDSLGTQYFKQEEAKNALINKCKNGKTVEGSVWKVQIERTNYADVNVRLRS